MKECYWRTHIYEDRSSLSKVLSHIAECRHHNCVCRPVGLREIPVKNQKESSLSQPFGHIVSQFD